MLPIAFASPLMLAALVALPALWILLRLIPPRPQRIDFPPLKILIDRLPTEETPAKTPWWLTLLRLGLAALVILMLAGPTWNPRPAGAEGQGPLLLLVDNGWAAARDFDARKAVLLDRIDEADRAGRPVALLAMADRPGDLSLAPAASVRARALALEAAPWTPDRTSHLGALRAFLAAEPSASVVWLSDGIGVGTQQAFLDGLVQALGDRKLAVIEDDRGPLALTGADNAPSALSVKVLRTTVTTAAEGRIRALDMKGLPLGEATYTFPADALETTARFELPVEIRNDVARLEIASEGSAGAVTLLDDRWRRRVVGVASGQTLDVAQPLLSATYYLAQALQPFADARTAEGQSPGEAIDRFIRDRLPMIALADVGTLGEAESRLEAWVEAGGVLVRFAGPRLAASDDKLVPVTLRRGDRTLGGALSWEQPQGLGAFPEGSPFAGMAIPADVSVTRQVLAEPDADLATRVWATLADGTPLVTGVKRGRGMIVLFHVTADTSWSNLPLSGSFVEMLRRVAALSGRAVDAPGNSSTDAAATLLAPSRTLDGQGRFRAPPGTAEPVASSAPGVATLEHPPGFYGPPEGLVAVNVLARDAQLVRLDYGSIAASRTGFAIAEPVDLKTPLLTAGLLLLLLDALIVFVMAGGLARARRGIGLAALVVLAVASLGPREALAQASQPYEAALKTHLAYVITGDRETDETSRAGLIGLTSFIAARTALEPGEPMGLDLARDELAFHALIYWPIVAGASPPSQEVMRKVDAFMKSGGTILFDTRDAIGRGAGFNSTPAGETLRTLLASLDIPPLEVVPRNHVLTKTFFLMETFPGRYEDGDTWVEAMPATTDEDQDRPAAAGDGVSPIIITSNDLAAAWAVGPDLEPLYPLVPGSPRQREMAYRAGANIIMYTLTGNYKSDQVHVPALLERLGQ